MQRSHQSLPAGRRVCEGMVPQCPREGADPSSAGAPSPPSCRPCQRNKGNGMLHGEKSLPSKVDMLYASIGSLRHDVERLMILVDTSTRRTPNTSNAHPVTMLTSSHAGPLEGACQLGKRRAAGQACGAPGRSGADHRSAAPGKPRRGACSAASRPAARPAATPVRYGMLDILQLTLLCPHGYHGCMLEL